MKTKAELVAELDRARTELGGQLHGAATEWRPDRLLRRSLARHRWFWTAGAAVAGLLLARRLLRPAEDKIRRDIAGASATKNSLISQILTPVYALIRQTAVTQGFQLIQTLLNPTSHRHEGDRPGP
jgi:hypothetical protein